MPTKTYYFFISFLFILNSALFGQIKIKEAVPQNLNQLDKTFFDISPTRHIRQLNDNWEVFATGESEQKVAVTVPSSFGGKSELNYITKLNFTKNEVKNNLVELVFLGVNYSAEIVLNEVLLYKHPGGMIPFRFELPKDILSTEEENTLIVKVNSELDSETTIPTKQRFLFPRHQSGILREVFLHFTPITGIKEFSVDYTLSEDLSSAIIKVSSEFDKAKKSANDTNLVANNFEANILIFSDSKNLLASKTKIPITFNSTNQASIQNNNLQFDQPKLWSPDFTNNYIITLQLVNNGRIIDETSKNLLFYSLERSAKGLLLNGKEFSFAGTAYFNNETQDDNLPSFSAIDSDLRKIKSVGFNTVQFSKSLPHPYIIDLCKKIGLFVFIQTPLNSVPDEFANDESFYIRAKNYIDDIFNYYSSHKIVEGIGLGSAYISNSPVQLSFIDRIASSIKERSNKTVYASFVGVPQKPLDNLDFYGIELFAESPSEFFNKFTNASESIGFNNIIISEATYPTYLGGTNGYSNKYSFEGQAKFFERVINFQRDKKLAGFFTNSFFDFKGDFNSLYTGYSKDKLYNLGVLSKDRTIGRMSAKVIESKLKDGEKVTIPIGTNSQNSPIAFILIGVGLSICMALLINSKRKFREDASRALLRPYNFFADIRDHRILSGVHSSLLMICLAGSLALLITILLFYLKNNYLLDKIILSFGSPNLSDAIGFLAWNPITSFIYLYAITIVAIILHTGMVKILSLFVKTKILITSIFFTIVWAILPLALLLPLQLVLHRVLLTEIGNLYIYIFLIVYMLWLIQRMMKGIYVIFDVRALTIYMYGFIIFIFLIGGILLYFQLAESTIYLIINSFKQYQLL